MNAAAAQVVYEVTLDVDAAIARIYQHPGPIVRSVGALEAVREWMIDEWVAERRCRWSR